MRICLRVQRRKVSRYFRITLIALLCTIFSAYLGLPVIFRTYPYIQGYFIFKNDVILGADVNFSNPEKYNLFGSYNHYVPSEPGIILGVWQILPLDLIYSLPLNKKDKKEWFLKQLEDSRPIVLYCHGNQPSRATAHRVMLYQLLQELNVHVVTFDYRGYADSSSVAPSEEGVVQDTLKMITWIRTLSSGPLYIWGHSLGTGIATKASRKLCLSGECPDALILQAPFTSLEEEIKTNRLTLPFRILPWFDYMILSPLRTSDLVFDSKTHIKYITSPILILHAEDDVVVPFELGRKLYDVALKNRSENSGLLKFVSFDARHKYGHNFIVKSPKLKGIFRNFLEESGNKLMSFHRVLKET